MYSLINGSPKTKEESNSMYFIKYISKYLNNYIIQDLKKDKLENVIDNIKKSDTIVLSFPLYIDSPTSITLELLDYIIDNKINIKGKNIYVIINCGFREGKHNITALEIIKTFANKTKSNLLGAILIGAGEIVGKEKFKYISRKALKDLDVLKDNIVNKTKMNTIITTMDLFTNKMYIKTANYSWKRQCKNNKLKEKDIRAT